METKTLLIIGAGFEQLPAIQLAKSLGFRVVVTDMSEKAVGVEYADVFGKVSTADKEGNLAFAKAQAIDGVMTLGSELAVPVVAYVAEVLGLPAISPQTALAATNKNVMRERFEQYAVPAPQSKRISSMAELQTFLAQARLPLVIKPSDCSGQRGVEKLEADANFELALAEAVRFSSDGCAIIEEFVQGPEINVTAVVQDGDIHFLSFSHRVTAEPPHFGIAVEHRSPVDLSETQIEQLKDASRQAIKSIGLENGIAYPQLIVNEHGAYVIEIAARIPGGYMREVAWLQSGIDMIEVAMRQALGEKLPIESYRKYPQYVSVIVKFLTELDLPDIKTLSVMAGFESVREDPTIYLACVV